MKKVFTFFVTLLLLCNAAIAQSPPSIPYQAVARDASGNLISNQAMSVRLTIHNGSAGGTIVYQETHSVTTNKLGLFNLSIGIGGSNITDVFSNIAWSSATKFMQVELDPAGGTNYTDMGTSQMLSVPYALYAASAGTATSVSGTTPSGGIIMYSGAWNFDGTGLGTGSLVGWALCNGNNSTPDLTEQFIMGAANSGEMSNTGGATTHTHTIPAITVPALSIPAVGVTGTIPALTVPALDISGTIPALTVPALDISGTIPAIGVTGTIPALSIPALSVPALSVPALSIPALTIAQETVTGTIPALNVALGNQPVYFSGSATIPGTTMEATSGAIGYSTAAGNVLELSTGGGASTGHTIANAATNGAVQSYTWTALQLQNPTVTSGTGTLGSGKTAGGSTATGTTTATTTGTGTTTATTTGTGTTTATTTGTGTLGSGTTVSYILATGNIKTTAGTTTATTLSSGNITTTAASTTAYTLGSGSLATGATTTGTGTTAATTTGSATSLPPYFKLAFIMKQ